MAALVLALVASYVSALNVAVSPSLPAHSQPLSQTLVSFSIEQDRWPDWTGTDSQNTFTHTVLSNYAALTGKPPDIRVGADSVDHSFWSPTETMNEDVFPTPNVITPYPEATHIVVGNDFYKLSRYLPQGTHMVWGVNLGADNATNAVNMANAIAGAFADKDVQAAGIVLDRIEVGNEPDLYTHNGLRPRNYTVKQYVAEWETSAAAVVQAMGMGKKGSQVKIQGAAFANQGFTPSQIFGLGILSSVGGKEISTISQHHYSGHFCVGGDFPLASFMNKAAIRKNLTMFQKDIAATQSHGLDYILGETNSIACHGAPGVSDTAGAALWVIDYTLHAATLGIKKAYFHEGVGYKYNFFQPVSLNRSIDDASPLNPPSAPQILPIYYGGLLINTFIGKTGSSKLVELTINDAYTTGYAVYEANKLVRVALVNLQPWLASSKGTRPSLTVNLTFSASAINQNSTITAQRLVLDHADDRENLTWGGRSWETADAQPTGDAVAETVSLASGVQLRASEAILIDFSSAVVGGGNGMSSQSTRASNDKYIAAGVVSGVGVAAILVVGGVYARRRYVRRRKVAEYFQAISY
ncbi:hypothetical protein GSI_00050 [Ganoderma sinense ZZ0214-1]|uniref:Beta-glucuronidase C-terminal domain-containing protein n=1 Tax=Ganoderma sinense ZZ0214-1 TaxID=1077348 RepID=A0A2G8SRJ0_9APHY|nr:hypothetical protein GSI_00050 [Ganoderma sinense ZZ0214-1]